MFSKKATKIEKIFTVDLTLTINLLPGYRGIMATRHVQFCCIFAVTKDKFDYFEKKFVSL